MPDDRRLRDVAHWRDTVQMPAYPSREAWLERAAHIKQRILLASGLLPLPERTPLNPIITGRVERDGYSVENVAFESFPGFYGTGNLYRPLHAPGKVPAVLAPHGHSQQGRLTVDDRFSVPARCINLALQGYVAFAPDMVGYNDSRQIDGHRTFESPERWLWGIGALGLQLWNNVRALDFLCTLPEVDTQRIACTGESGGASQTFLLTAVDERVRVVAPVNMLSAHYAGGCVCENAPGLRLELTNLEIVACAAPRPMLLVSATGDWTVNTPRVEYPAVRSIYELFGAEDHLECVQIDAPHNYNRDSREAVYGFLARYLGGKGKPAPRPAAAVFWTGPSEPLREAEVTPEPAEERRVFPDGAPLPEGAPKGNEAVTRHLKALHHARFEAALPRDAASLDAFRRTYGPVLREVLAASAPASDQVAIEHRTRDERDGIAIEHFEIVGQRYGERLPAALATPPEATGVPALLVDPQGSLDRLAAELGPEQSRPMLAVDVFLTGRYLSPFGAAGRPVSETHFAGYNRVDAAWRVQDALTAAVALRKLAGAPAVDFFGHAEAGPWALLARAVAPDLFRRAEADLRGWDWEDESVYLDQLCVPHLLRAGGLAAALALAAPAPLTLHVTDGAALDWLRDLYTALGASDRLVVTEERGSSSE